MSPFDAVSPGPRAQTVEELIRLFDALFWATENTRLVRGEKEPLYLPAHAGAPWAQIVFAHGFFASALHEVAHWCVAGKERRKLVDYGYWYKPDGRNFDEQREFEAVEAKPQALEWIFSVAAGTTFHLSVDNLGGELEPGAVRVFHTRVATQVGRFLVRGLPPRAAEFAVSLSRTFGTGLKYRQMDSYRVVDK